MTIEIWQVNRGAARVALRYGEPRGLQPIDIARLLAGGAYARIADVDTDDLEDAWIQGERGTAWPGRSSMVGDVFARRTADGERSWFVVAPVGFDPLDAESLSL